MKAHVFAQGNLGEDAKLITLENGRSVITFNIATLSTYIDASGEKVQSTQWHTCKRFLAKPSEKLVQVLTRGTAVTVSGKLMYDHWIQQVGNNEIKRSSCYIDVDEIALV